MLMTWNAVSTLDRMLDDVMGSAFGAATSPRTFDPAIDVQTAEHELVLYCDVPGVKQDDLEVTLQNHILTIKGMRRLENDANEHVIRGRAHGSFARSFTLPDTLDDERLAADLADGVLTVRIPKQPKGKLRKIQIGGGSAKQLNE